MPKLSELKVGDRIVIPDSEYARLHHIVDYLANVTSVSDIGISFTIGFFVFKNEFEPEEVKG